MFAWWGRTVVAARWWVLAATAVFVVIGGVWGTGIFGALSGGGFDDPASPSSRAHQRIDEDLGRQGKDILALYSSPTGTVDQPALREPVRAVVGALRERPEVTQVVSYYDTPAPGLVSADRHATYVAIQLRDGSEDAKLVDLEAIRPLLVVDSPEVTTEIGGLFPFVHDANTQIESDIIKAEIVSMPILLVLMILIFRGLVAAATPLLVGVVAILGAFTATRLLANFTDVSAFAANIITMLGLGMAIDYALFVVSRFREELRSGHSTAIAIERTIATAGRTVAVSGLTVAMALASLLLFPMDFLKSMGYGGMAAVLVGMLAALTALPALLAVVGPRINALRVPSLRRRPATLAAASTESTESTVSTERDGGWARLARSVMRRPVLYLLAVTIVLGAIAAPFLRATFGGFDERVLPEGTPSRTVAERISNEFPGGSIAPIVALVSGASPGAAQDFANRVRNLPDVTGAEVTATRGTSSLVSITYAGEPTSEEAREVVRSVRATAPPPDAEVLVGGRPSADVDQIASLGGRLPWMALFVGVVTFLLLFFAFGSVVLPLKAILMNVVSIGASFGVVVWIFQDGHLADWLGFTSTGFLEPTNIILMLAILFGLSTDYEVFLLSRVREEWDATGDNRTAVAAGLQRTGGIITAAALLLIVVIGGFATGGAATIKMLGIGTLVAVAVDAALVRTLLVPATMRLLGRWNWWAPGPLAKVYRRYGLRESATLAEPINVTESAPLAEPKKVTEWATLASRPSSELDAPAPEPSRSPLALIDRRWDPPLGRIREMTVVYATPSLIVRPWTHSDSDHERIFDTYSRWEVARWLGSIPRALESRDDVPAIVDRWTERSDVDALTEGRVPRFGVWAVEMRGTGVVAGTVLLVPLPDPDGTGIGEVEVGWHFHPDSWGHGYATEAARGAIAHGFAQGLDEIYAVVRPDNEKSLAVCRRLAMTPLGRTNRWYDTELEAFRADRA